MGQRPDDSGMKHLLYCVGYDTETGIYPGTRGQQRHVASDGLAWQTLACRSAALVARIRGARVDKQSYRRAHPMGPSASTVRYWHAMFPATPFST